MSPEQLMGEKPSAAMDVYSFGVVLYECLAGHTPFYTGDIKHQILTKEPPEITDLPGHTNMALQSALSKEASTRPSKAATLIARLTGGDAPEAILLGVAPAIPQKVIPPVSPPALSVEQSAANSAANPFIFGTGEKAHNVESLAHLCAKNADMAQWHLRQGHFEPWLRSIEEMALADHAERVRRSSESPRDSLVNFLRACGRLGPSLAAELVASEEAVQKERVLAAAREKEAHDKAEAEARALLLARERRRRLWRTVKDAWPFAIALSAVCIAGAGRLKPEPIRSLIPYGALSGGIVGFVIGLLANMVTDSGLEWHLIGLVIGAAFGTIAVAIDFFAPNPVLTGALGLVLGMALGATVSLVLRHFL
jgi:hypothetical protein